MTPRQMLRLYALVALGSAIGGVLRAIASLVLHTQPGPGLPWGTLFVNVTGSFAIAFYATLCGPGGRLRAGPGQRHFVMAGVCGGYTTFSIFSLEILRLAQAGELAMAGLTAAGSLVAWLAAAWLGYVLAAALNRVT